MNKNRSVVAIPPSYNRTQDLELESTAAYLSYLERNGVDTVMTTAGTSQFNLMNVDEINDFNECVKSSFSGQTIIGIPALPAREAHNFAHDQHDTENTKYMAIYPDRFYDKETIYRYVSTISEAVGGPIYLHTPKMRSGRGGDWDYDADTINNLYNKGLVIGLKEEHSSLAESFNFVSNLDQNLDVIVAGGSMRRFCFLHPAGANSFLSGVGNIFPNVEQEFIARKLIGEEVSGFVRLETQLFNVFMKYGWHQSLRIALRIRGLTCFHDRQPWPKTSEKAMVDIAEVLETF